MPLNESEAKNMAKKYLDPRADVTFKKVFGEHKNLVISFLNALLPLDEGKKVESIEYLPSEIVPQTPTRKNTSVDVRCEETGGRKFIVEMQMNWTDSFKQRVIFNSAKAYVSQMPKGEDYESLQPVYSLNLVNKTFEPDLDEYYHYYQFVHDLHSNKVLEGLHLVFIELPKFKAKNLTEKKMQVLWLRFLTEIGESTEEAPQDLIDNPQVNEALEIVKESAYSEAERMPTKNSGMPSVARKRFLATSKENSMRLLRNSTRQMSSVTRQMPSVTRQMPNAMRPLQRCGKTNSTPPAT